MELGGRIPSLRAARVVTDFSSCSLSGCHVLSSHFTSDSVNIHRGFNHTLINKKMLSSVLFVVVMHHCHSSPSFKASLSKDGCMKNDRVL